MKKRYIFDLDGTLLTGDFSATDDYFKNIFGPQAEELSASMGKYLGRYERLFDRYDIDLLSKYLSMRTKLPISPSVIRDWINEMDKVLDFKEEEVEQVLDTLKRNDKSIAVLTNWFGATQIPRLEKAGLIDYFDDIYTGEQVLKPHKQAYHKAALGFNPEEVLFIGDNVDFDYVGPRACGYQSILYDKEDRQHKTIQKVKRLNEILNIE